MSLARQALHMALHCRCSGAPGRHRMLAVTKKKEHPPMAATFVNLQTSCRHRVARWHQAAKLSWKKKLFRGDDDLRNT